jgi:hypothetical protein
VLHWVPSRSCLRLMINYFCVLPIFGQGEETDSWSILMLGGRIQQE